MSQVLSQPLFVCHKPSAINCLLAGGWRLKICLWQAFYHRLFVCHRPSVTYLSVACTLSSVCARHCAVDNLFITCTWTLSVCLSQAL